MKRSMEAGPDGNKNNTHISRAISELEVFTNNLEGKVNGILKAQESEFVNSYKNHMLKVKKEFDDLTHELYRKDQIISNYESQGKMSYLIKKIHFLEDQEKKLLADLDKKKTDLKELNLENQIQKSEIKRLDDKVKEMIRNKASMTEKMEKDYESIPTFTTELDHDGSKDKLSKMMTQQRSIKMRSVHRRSQRSEISINPQATESNRLHKQIMALKRQNRELLSFNSKFISETSENEKFFVQVISQIKKNITARKQIKECSLQQFRKQDKLQLLIKILSNDDIILHLYKAIFCTPSPNAKIQRAMSIRNKFTLRDSSVNILPNINPINSARIN